MSRRGGYPVPTYEKVKAEFEKRGYTLLSTEYVNAREKLKYMCDKGHYNEISWNNFDSKKAGCMICGGRAKPSFDYVKSVFEDRDCVLLSDTYVNAKTKLEYICADGHECETTWDKFRQGRGCLICSGNQKKTIEQVRKEFEERGFKLLSTEYKNAHEFLYYICPDGHKNKIKYNKFQQGGGCRECFFITLGDIRRKTQEEFEQEVFDLVGDEYTVLGEYKNTDVPILMKHNICDLEWGANPYNFLKTNSRCPNCNGSKGETIIYEYLINRKFNFIPQYKIDECRNIRPLPFDFAIFDENSNLKYLIEYQGQQHYIPVEHFGGIDAFLYRKGNDIIKQKYCRYKQIPLLRIPFWDFDKIGEILDKELTQNI